MTLAIIAGSWIYRTPDLQSDCLTALPWILGVLVSAKAGLAGWAIRFLRIRALMSPQTIALLLIGWLASVVVILAGIWYFIRPSWLMVSGTLLFIPFTRLVIAPAALHWNRHR